MFIKKINYVNKCKIDLMTIDDFMKKPVEEVRGKRIIAVQENDYISSGVLFSENELLIIMNYTDHKLESLKYLLGLKNVEDADINLYDYEEYRKSIETKSSAYDSVKALNYGFKYVLILDDIDIVIDAPDEPFKRNVLNMITFDKSIDYYSRGPVLVVQNDCNVNEIQTMAHYPESNFNDGHFIELQAYDIIDDVQYLNYHFNIEYYVNGQKLDMFK